LETLGLGVTNVANANHVISDLRLLPAASRGLPQTTPQLINTSSTTTKRLFIDSVSDTELHLLLAI
jgi:hypothetical protein